MNDSQGFGAIEALGKIGGEEAAIYVAQLIDFI